MPANGAFGRSLVMPNGDVIIGGSFTISGSANIARYNPTANTWSGLGGGVNGNVEALALTPDGDVIVAGSFSQAGGPGGVAASNIARWNTASGTWSALGTGTNFQVNAVVVVAGGDVIAGGYFTIAGGVNASRIARYNPTTNTWAAMGSGVTGGNSSAQVNGMALLQGGDVILVGDFWSAGGAPAGGIGRYNPTSGAWSALGNSLIVFYLYCVAVLPSGEVLTGGFGQFQGGPPQWLIAQGNLTTNTWNGRGTYVNQLTTGMTVLPGGDAILYGGWETAAGLTANHLLRYNPTTNVFSTLGTGITPVNTTNVRGVAALPDGDLLVTGLFANAGGVTVNNIARYSSGRPAPSILAQPIAQTTCPSGTTQFTVVATSNGGGALSYRWQWQPAGAGMPWVDLVAGDNADDGGTSVLNAADVGTATLRTRPLIGYINIAPRAMRCMVTSACGSTASDEAVLTSTHPGDLNCDGNVNNFDIDAFVIAVLDPAGYALAYPGCNILNGDVDCDSRTNNFDIDPFVSCVLHTGCP